MKATKLLLAAVGGALLWRYAQTCTERELQRRLDTPGAKPEPETSWEGEGGALLKTGAQTGPDPQQP